MAFLHTTYKSLGCWKSICFLKCCISDQFVGKLLLEDDNKIQLLSFDGYVTFFEGLGLKGQSLKKLEVSLSFFFF